jgi:hypothetical protein
MLNGQGVARTSREGHRDQHAAVNSEFDHPPERGMPITNAEPARQ